MREISERFARIIEVIEGIPGYERHSYVLMVGIEDYEDALEMSGGVISSSGIKLERNGVVWLIRQSPMELSPVKDVDGRTPIVLMTPAPKDFVLKMQSAVKKFDRHVEMFPIDIPREGNTHSCGFEKYTKSELVALLRKKYDSLKDDDRYKIFSSFFICYFNNLHISVN